MKFYSVVLKKAINIPDNKVKEVIKKGRKFAVGEYTVGKKVYQAWRVLGLAGKKR